MNTIKHYVFAVIFKLRDAKRPRIIWQVAPSSNEAVKAAMDEYARIDDIEGIVKAYILPEKILLLMLEMNEDFPLIKV